MPIHASQTPPGPLHSQTWLTLHTRHAQRLIVGRIEDGKPVIIGLNHFASLLRHISCHARQGDVYAHWWLIKVEEALQQAHEALGQLRDPVQQRLQASPLDISPALSTEPVRVPLAFASPYAFRAATLIATYDTLAATLLSAAHHALITGAERERLLHLAGRRVRSALSAATGYQSFGIRAADIEQNSPQAVLARQKLGVIPAEVVCGQRRPAHSGSGKL